MNKRTITIDNGGSELRAIYNSNGTSREVFCMDKNITTIKDLDPRIKESVEPLDLIHIVDAPNDQYKGMYCTGTAYYMYGGTDVSMDNQRHKAESLAWYQQILLAIAKEAMKASIETIKAARSEDEEAPAQDAYDYVMSTLIPVNEHSGAKDYVSMIKKNFAGFYRVQFPALTDYPNEVAFTLSEDRIGVLPEGVVCMARMAKIVGPNDHTLILDVGHVSTDLSICRGTKLFGSSVITTPFAGGTLIKLIDGIANSHNYLATTDMSVEMMNTGKMRIGAREIDVNEEITSAKQTFVRNYLKRDVLREIEMSGLTANNIRYVVPIGAVLGTKNGKTGERDILQMLIEECSLENAEVRLFDDDLRYVNIKAAADFCDALSARF